MCGISGFFDQDGQWGREELEKMNGSMAHRGPDAAGVFLHGPAGLAHRRLSIIDLSAAANQPMVSHCGRYTMVYNGEIYNFREILQDIQKADPSFKPRTTSDTEVALQAFVLWGTGFLSRLNGMFVMAIYDQREECLFLFRDRMGIKPVYYYESNGRFMFASELKALTALPALAGKLSVDPEAVTRFLHLGYIPAPWSIYREIRKLPAGTIAKVNRKGFSMERWWSPAQMVRQDVISHSEEALQQLEELLESAVRYRLIADVPYGTFLSGGIDSSLVTALAQKVSTSPLNTFTVGFPGTSFNEAHYARDIATHLGTNHHEMFLTEQETLEWLPTFFDTYDEPFADSSGIPSLLIAHFARKHVTMTLSGDGGDELFLGYGSYRWAQRLSRLQPSWMRSLASGALNLGSHRMQRAAKVFGYENPQSRSSHIFSQEQYCFSRKEIRKLFTGAAPEIALQEQYHGLGRTLTPAEQQALFDMHYYLPDDLLVKVDRATMAASLETRVPLLDYRVTEFALNLDPMLKWQQGQTKWLLKELLKKHVPEKLFDRPKKGFAIPLNHWLQTDLKFLAEENLSAEAIRMTGLLDPVQVQKLLKGYYSEKKQYLYQRVWLLIVLQQWLTKNSLRIT
jgi:asparagine synthase (glutamine-hydrolysing)